MRHQDHRINLKEARDIDDGDFLLHRVEGLDEVRAHGEIDAAGGEQQPRIDLRAALQDAHLQPVAGVGAVGDRLIEAAMLRLRPPVRREGDLVERLRWSEAGEEEKEQQSEQAAGHGDLLGWAGRLARLSTRFW